MSPRVIEVSSVKDYRLTSMPQLKEFLEAAEAADPSATYPACIRGYVTGSLPHDRRGLMAAFHDQTTIGDKSTAIMMMAEQLARQTNQRVYIVYTTTRWHLLLLALEITTSVGVEGEHTKVWYDDMPGGVYANDQYIAHVDPDGTFAVDGTS